ncbi:hypothetical protein Tco_0218639 [Tanacetum coccineum]
MESSLSNSEVSTGYQFGPVYELTTQSEVVTHPDYTLTVVGGSLRRSAINGFDMPLPVAVCSGLVNPLAPRKVHSTFTKCYPSYIHPRLLTLQTSLLPIPSIEQVTISTQKTQPQVPKSQQTVDPSCAQHVKTPRQPIRTPVTPSPIPSYNRQNWNQGMQRDLDRLTKSAHFLPIRKDYPVSKLAEMFWGRKS